MYRLRPERLTDFEICYAVFVLLIGLLFNLAKNKAYRHTCRLHYSGCLHSHKLYWILSCKLINYDVFCHLVL
jgi:hypothetical protein